VSLPSIRGLEALSALARSDSLAAAARGLGVTRSALSHRIADLEHQLGVRLVRPEGRCATLTDEARSLLAVMGDSLERIEAAVAPLRRRRAQLRISTVATFASHWLIPRLADWQSRYPEIELLLSTSTRPVDLDREDFDAGIRHGLGHWPGIDAQLLFRETLVPVAATGLVVAASTPVIRARSRWRDWMRWSKGGDALDPQGPILVVENRAQAMDAVLAGAGITVMEGAFVLPHIQSSRLRALGTTVTLSEGYYLVRSRAAKRNDLTYCNLANWLSEQVA